MDTIIKKKKSTFHQYIGYISTGIFILTIILYGISAFNAPSEISISKNKLQIAEVTNGLFHDYINIKGKIQPHQTIYLDAVERGRVKEIVAQEGSFINEGDIIIALENNELYQQILNSEVALAEKENYLRNTKINFRNDLIQSQKNLVESEYQLKRTERNYKQQERLLEKGLVAEEEYIKAKEDFLFQKEMLKINKMKAENDKLLQETTMQTLEEDLVKMRATLELVQSRLEHLEIKAPSSAYLGNIKAEIGQSIQQGQHLGVLYDLSEVKVIAEIDERYITKVKKGLKASYQFQNQNYDLVLQRIYPEVKESLFKVELIFEKEKPENLHSGQTTNARLSLGNPKESLLLNKGNFYSETAGQWVYVLSEDGKTAQKRKIKIGDQNIHKYEILDGLKAGEKVVISQYNLLGDYDQIVFE
ncbi:efflux RND transporter periplasmic adaptor subunit [Flammeovirga sp. OC4]|uniref:efflux RND transporter periplasmic adaptor subunit n=1 Tax=Flammeovirga sp. OC4 TaxID=1382345 RepID=UPI0005C66873|nr:efflux RND transporter periplasmic adaptor subunit [Flammeovirga sp. OC4]